MSKIPIFEDFRQCVLKEYAAIMENYSFIEKPLPDREFVNQIQVRLSNATTLIIVEGISYGIDAWTIVTKFTPPIDDNYGLPVW